MKSLVLAPLIFSLFSCNLFWETKVSPNFFNSLDTRPGGYTETATSYLSDAGADIQDLKLVDMDADGDLDIVTANTVSETMSIYLNDGAGNFSLYNEYATISGSNPIRVRTGHFNNDNYLDVYLVTSPNAGGNQYQSTGLLTFSAPSPTPTGMISTDAEIADLNGDGYDDVVLYGRGANDDFYFFSGSLTGLTSEPSYSTMPIEFYDIFLTNFDGGLLDVVGVTNNGELQFHAGASAAFFTFSAAQATHATCPGGTPKRMDVADFDRDGRVDFAVTCTATSQLDIDLGVVGFGAIDQQVISNALSDPQDVAAADLNRDGIIDLTVANFTNNTVSIYIGLGNGSFEDTGPVIISTSSSPYAVAVGDVNGDSRADLAISDTNGVSIFLQTLCTEIESENCLN